jgi:cytochrome c oxidase subunit II
MVMKSAISRWGSAAALLASVNLICCKLAVAADPVRWQLNMSEGVTETSRAVYRMHMISLWICVVIGIIVFGAMIIAMIRDRKSRGVVAATWSHNTKAELVWTIAPILILVVMAYPATNVLINMADSNDAGMTIKVTGYQWKWRYDYIDYNQKAVGYHFLSKLDGNSDKTRQLQSGLNPNDVLTDGKNTYLLNVDKPLVVPVDTKIRFVVTADDVIHAWWVPALGWKQDAIPGIINDAWTNIHDPGIYRGQCAELCGQDHGFMPIVVIAKPKAEFEQWLAAAQAQEKAEAEADAAAAAAPAPPAVEAAKPAGSNG